MNKAALIERLFLAILPPSEVAANIGRRVKSTTRAYQFSGRPVSADRLHISLHHLGEFEPPIPADLPEAIGRLAETVRFKPFQVTFDRALSFKGKDRRPYVLTGGSGLDDLRSFHAALGTAFGLKTGLFTPHLTLLYDLTSITEHSIQPVSWMVRDFALVLSHVGRARYDILGRWPL